MDQEAVDGLERTLGEVLVGPMDRVAGLEADDPFPAALGEGSAGVGRVERELGERRLRPLEDGYLAGQVERLLRVEPCNARMGLVGGAKRVPGLALLVVLVGLVHLEGGERLARLVGERGLVALGLVVDGETDRQRPWNPLREAHVLEHALVIVSAHEALERRERPGGEHVQIGQLARGQRDLLQAVHVVRFRPGAVDQVSAMRPNQLRGSQDA